jgi:hypothetical protein
VVHGCHINSRHRETILKTKQNLKKNVFFIPPKSKRQNRQSLLVRGLVAKRNFQRKNVECFLTACSTTKGKSPCVDPILRSIFSCNLSMLASVVRTPPPSTIILNFMNGSTLSLQPFFCMRERYFVVCIGTNNKLTFPHPCSFLQQDIHKLRPPHVRSRVGGTLMVRPSNCSTSPRRDD